MLGALLITGYFLLYLYILHRSVASECDGTTPYLLQARRSLNHPRVWITACYMSMLIGFILNINAVMAMGEEVSLKTITLYYEECKIGMVLFFLIPFCVSSASSFLALTSEKSTN